MFLVAANTRQAIVGQKEWITTGSSGIQVQFLFSSDWDGLAKFAVFRNAEIEESVIPIALPESGLTELPAENCAAEYVDEKVYVGVYGTDGLGHIIIPTIWVSLGVLKEGAAYEGMDPPQPTPDMWAQILAIAQNAGAENAAAAEQSAEEAEASKEAIQDMNVQAETLPDESPLTVTKEVDPETGAVTLIFGLTRGPKGNKGDDGYSPTITITPIQGGHRFTVTDKEHPSGQSFDVMNGAKGDKGYSPAITITTITGGHRFTVTDEDHPTGQSFDVMDGAKGDAGYSPAVTITTITGGHRVTITDEDHPTGQSFDVLDGASDAGKVSYDETQTYQSGTVGNALTDQKNAISEKAPVIINTASGDIASFADGADGMPMKIVGTIVPQQDLHGQSAPYPAGGGINLLNPNATTDNMRLDNNGGLIAGDGWCVSDWISVTANTDYFTSNAISSASGYVMCVYDVNKSFLRYKSVWGGGNTVQNSGADAAYVRVTVNLSKKAESMFAQSSSYLPFSPYENICPISGWNGANIYNEETYDTSATPKLSINWQTVAGTIYGGSITLNEDNSVDIVSYWSYIHLGALSWSKSGVRFESGYIDGYRLTGGVLAVVADCYKGVPNMDGSTFNTGAALYDICFNASASRPYLIVKDDRFTTESEIKNYLNGHYALLRKYVYTQYHLENIGQLFTVFGANSVWIDTGAITECDYPADTKLFLTARDEEITGSIAPIENGTTASQEYAQGAYFWHDAKFCKALTAIANGATFTLNTNYTETTVAAELLAAQN